MAPKLCLNCSRIPSIKRFPPPIPLHHQVPSLTTSQTGNDAVLAGLITSISFTLLLAVGFSFLRPYNSIVYAPKLKVADEKHAPPALGRGVLAWLGPVLKTNEQDLIQLVGLDATIFLRFQCLLRNLFLALTLIGCGILVPVNLINGKKSKGLYKITPLNTFGRSNWATVAVAWLVVFTMMGILYWEYRAVLRLRRQYYDSMEYKTSLHARTLMVCGYSPCPCRKLTDLCS